MMKSKQFNIFQETIKSVTGENDELYITGIANTGERDLVGDIVTETALQQIAGQAINRNLHFNHNGNYDDTLTELTESIIGVITESTVVDEGVSITAKILPKHVEVIKYFLENDVKFGLSISGKAHYADNSFEEIESWDLTEISLVPIPCDQGTMGTVQISKSFNEFIKSITPQNKMEEKNMAEDNDVTLEAVQELINTAFNEKEEELLEQVRGELKEEYEAVINEIKERIETIESQIAEPKPQPGEGEGEGEGEGKGEGQSEEEKEEEEKQLQEKVDKRVEELISNIFGKHSPNFNYKNSKGDSTPNKTQKSFTAREIAEIITGGN